jgi:hypothetical protein
MNPEEQSPLLCMLVTLSLALFACEHAVAPEVERYISLETDKNTYHVNEIITVTMINKTNIVIPVTHCCVFTFQLLSELNGEWTPLEWRLCPPLCDTAPIHLKPGEKVTEHVQISETGRYIFRAAYGKGESTFNFDEGIRSNAFSVQPQR